MLPLTVFKKFVTITPETEVTPLKIKKITLSALLCAIALTIFMVEARIPSPVPIPGVKLGLANIVTVFAVFVLGPGYAAWILAGRVFLGALFSGNFALACTHILPIIAYSVSVMAAAVLCFLGQMKKQ